MSMILDALRRAEADRQRGAVPGLHAPQPVLAPAPAAGPLAGGSRAWGRAGAWLALLLVLGALLLAAGWWWQGSALRPAAQTQALPGSPGPAGVPVAAGPAPAAPLVAEAPAWPRVVSAPPAPPGPTAVPAAEDSTRAPAGAPTPTPRAAAAAPASAVLSPLSPTAAAPRRLADLTPAERSALPPLVLGGSVWSDNRSSRFVVLDGQVLREGDTVAPGLVLERLAPRAAVLRWRGAAIELPL